MSFLSFADIFNMLTPDTRNVVEGEQVLVTKRVIVKKN